MRNLLGFSEEKLKTVKENISILREKINKVLATLRVFKGLFLAAKKKDEDLSRGLPAEDIQNIHKGITDDIKNGNTNKDDGTVNSVLNSVLSGITRLTAGIIKAAVNRSSEIRPMLDVALSKLNDAIAILPKLREAFEKQEKDLELVIIWKDAVQTVITNVFSVDAEARKEADQDLFNEIKAIIEGGDVEQIYEAYNVLKDAAQNYLA